MMIRKIQFLIFSLLLLSIGFLQSCKNKNPSVVKIYVRNASNQLISDAMVVLVGDVDSDPETLPYVDTVFTNESGFAYFNVQPYYDNAGEEYEVAYFNVIAKTASFSGTGYIRSRVHTTAVETIYIQ